MSFYKQNYQTEMKNALRELNITKVKKLIHDDREAFQKMNNKCITKNVIGSLQKDDTMSHHQRHNRRVEMLALLKKNGVDVLCKKYKDGHIFSSSIETTLFNTWAHKNHAEDLDLLYELCRNDPAVSISILKRYRSDIVSKDQKLKTGSKYQIILDRIDNVLTKLQQRPISQQRQQQYYSSQGSDAFYTGSSILVGFLISATIILIVLQR